MLYNSDQFSSIRNITILTPNSYMKKMIVVSTTFNHEGKGETGVLQFAGLNYFDFDQGHSQKIPFKTVKHHTNFEEAMKFHDNLVKHYKYKDCETVTAEDLLRDAKK